MLVAIKDLISKGAIKVVSPQEDQFTSTVFLVRKENGDFRPVINLRPLNQFLVKEKFKMEGLHVVRSIIHQGDFMMKLDLKDAYYAIPIYQQHRRYLRFVFQGIVYEFQCLPFGLSSAPRAFTKALKPVLAVIRTLGIRTVMYIDDMLLLQRDRETLQVLFRQVVAFLEKLGFLVNSEKCSPIPMQKIVFLGAQLDSVSMKLYLPDPKLTQIKETCRSLRTNTTTTIQTLATLVGQMNHAAQTGIWQAPLHYRGLQRQHLQVCFNARPEGSNPDHVYKTCSLGPGLVGLSGTRQPQWTPFPASPIRCDNLDRRIETRMGGQLSRSINRRSLESRGGQFSHQHPGIAGSNPSPESPCTRKEHPTSEAHSLTNGQHHSCSLRQQERGNSLLSLNESSARALGRGTRERDMVDSSAYPRGRELRGGCSIETDRVPHRMDIEQTSFSSYMSEVLPTGSRPLCLETESSASQLRIPFSGPRINSSRCVPAGLGTVDNFCQPTDNPDPQDSTEDQTGSCENTVDSAELEGATLASSTPAAAGGLPSSTPPRRDTTLSTISTIRAPPPLEVSPPGGMAAVRERYRSEGFSEEAISILLSSWSEATQKR